MSDPKTLRTRIEAAFSNLEKLPPAVAPVDEEGRAPVLPLRAPEKVERRRLVSPGLIAGGVGLLLAAALVATGQDPALPALLAAISTILAGGSLAERLGGVEAKRRGEQDSDRRWQGDETANLIFTIHDSLGDIAVTRGMDKRIVEANALFRDYLGIRHPEGMSFEALGLRPLPGPDPDCLDLEIATPLGRRIFAWHDIVIRHPADGRLLTQSIGRDVTDERQVTRAREEARVRAERASAAKSQLLATVSHEVRTPLGGILGMSHLLGQTHLTAEQRNYLDGIRHSTNALVQLVGDLLDFSSIEAGRFTLHPQPEPIRPLIEGVVEMLSYRAHEKGIEIASTVSADIPDVLDVDPARLRQVLFNLIGNAVKFTYQGGILVSARMEASDLLIDVTDTGPGLTEAEQARIFADYAQAGTARDRGQGTGLGLAISARIAHALGGALTLKSQPGEGSTFTLRMPLDLFTFPKAQNPRAGLLVRSAVLLVAPDGPAARAMRQTVTGLGGSFTLAETAAEAIAILEAGQVEGRSLTDLVVDHRMGDLYARELAKRPEIGTLRLRRVFLVNPEDRRSRHRTMFDSWLIRPLREQSLTDVLRGRMRGMEKRDAINDNQPGTAGRAGEELPQVGYDILVGEDDPVNAMLVRTVLERAGHKVRLASNFQMLGELLSDMSQPVPDLIVTDLGMPGGDGIDFVADLRQRERLSGAEPLPLVVLTADTQDETRKRALSVGADTVLVKPAEPARLLETVRAVVYARGRKSSPEQSAG